MQSTAQDRIQIDPNVCHGKPIIQGTRVMVRTILGAIAGGDSPEKIATAYDITVEDVRAAVKFANELVAEWDYLPIRG